MGRKLALLLKAKSIETPAGCWEWTGGFHGVGYGSVSGKLHKSRYAHRAMYEGVVSEIPSGMYVLHSCDNRKCINPAHLFLGTHLDNIKDMHAKNRQRGGSMPNERNPNCKFSDAQIIAIRAARLSGETISQTMRRTGISETHYYRVVKDEARKNHGV